MVNKDNTNNTDNAVNEKIEELEDKIKELEDNNLRTHADFQNIKKRLEKEKLNSIKYAQEKFALDILDVLDSLYIAVQIIKDEKEKEGINNTIKKLIDIFNKYNIAEVLYDTFNPNLHQAVQSVDSDKDPGEIVDVLRKGYTIHDKILRPAMVLVSN